MEEYHHSPGVENCPPSKVGRVYYCVPTRLLIHVPMHHFLVNYYYLLNSLSIVLCPHLLDQRKGNRHVFPLFLVYKCAEAVWGGWRVIGNLVSMQY